MLGRVLWSRVLGLVIVGLGLLCSDCCFCVVFGSVLVGWGRINILMIDLVRWWLLG